MAAFVVACTGHLWHLYQQDESGRLLRVNHDSLPAYTVDVCLKIIVDLGHGIFTVRIINGKKG